VWGYPALPVLFVIASALIVLNQIVADPTESAVGLALVAVGFPVYLYWSRHAHR
jgi:APA family basic amino acid/polyamine antiporter